MKVATQAKPITNGAQRFLVLGLSSAGGLGYIPVASGTWGSLPGLVLGAALLQIDPIWAYAVCMALIVASAPIVQRACLHWGTLDSGRVVWDEVLGQAIAILGLRATLELDSWTLPVAGSVWRLPPWPYFVIAFFLFRLFDITKPFPAKIFDRKGTGLGVILDDVVAGIYAGLVTWALYRLKWPLTF